MAAETAKRYGLTPVDWDAWLTASKFIKFDGGAYVVLEEGDEIRAQSELDSTMSIINTIELIRKG